MLTTGLTQPLIVGAFVDRPILVVIYAITIGISVWLFRDTRRRGKSAIVGAGWAIGGLLLPAVVHFIYLYRRMQSEGSLTEPPADKPE